MEQHISSLIVHFLIVTSYRTFELEIFIRLLWFLDGLYQHLFILVASSSISSGFIRISEILLPMSVPGRRGTNAGNTRAPKRENWERAKLTNKNTEYLVLLKLPQRFRWFTSLLICDYMQSSGDVRTPRARRVHPHVRGVRAPLGAQVVREIRSLTTSSYQPQLGARACITEQM